MKYTEQKRRLLEFIILLLLKIYPEQGLALGICTLEPVPSVTCSEV